MVANEIGCKTVKGTWRSGLYLTKGAFLWGLVRIQLWMVAKRRWVVKSVGIGGARILWLDRLCADAV